MKARTLLWIGIAVFSLTVIIACISIGLNFYIRNLLRDGLVDLAQISSDQNSRSYKQWKKNYPDNENCQQHSCYYTTYRFWNLTNAVDVQLNGAKPKYDLVGPYVYWDQRDRRPADTGFLNNRLSFEEKHRFTFVAEKSAAGATIQDRIINVNPVYMGAILAAGGDENALFTYAGGQIMQQVVQLLGPAFGYLGYVIPRQQTFAAAYDPSVFAPLGGFASPQIASVLVSTDAAAECDKQFPVPANATHCKTYVASLSFGLGIDTSTQQGLQTAIKTVSMLVNPMSPISIANQNFDGSKAFSVSCYLIPMLSGSLGAHQMDTSGLDWKSLLTSLKIKIDLNSAEFGYGARSVGGIADMDVLAQLFGAELSKKLCAWAVHDDATEHLDELTVQLFSNVDPGVQSVSDLIYLEWARGLVTFGNDVLPLLTNGTAYLSFYNWVTAVNGTVPDDATLTVAQTKILFSPAIMFTTANYLRYLGMCQVNPAAAEQFFHLPAGFCGPFLAYVQVNLNHGAIPYLLASPALSLLTGAVGAGPRTVRDDPGQPASSIGMFVARTVDQWLWNCTDPLLKVPCNLQDGDPDGYVASYSRMLTGNDQDDASSAWMFDSWANSTFITGAWEEPEIVHGTDASRFRPLLLDVYDEKTKPSNWRELPIFVPEIYRSLHVDFEDDIDYKGLTLWRYRLEMAALATSSRYYQGVRGIGNLTRIRAAPIFVSKFNFFDAEDWVRDAIEVLHTPTGRIILEEDLDDTVLDIEPYSGLVLRGYKRLQINVQIPPNYIINDAKNMHRSAVQRVFYPILQVENGGAATDDDIAYIQRNIYTPLLIATILFWGGISVGIAGTLAALAICVFSRRKAKKEAYAQLS
eukprot:ANDGO_05613.mRNA.1 Lysosome membrane protein 2-A